MPKFEIDLNKLPEEPNLPSSPERRASLDLIRQQGESSTSRAGQRPIRDFTRHFAETSCNHQAQGEASRQQDPARSGVARWRRPREAQRPPEQSLLDDALAHNNSLKGTCILMPV